MAATLELKQELWQHVFKDEQLIIQLTKAHAANCAKESIDPLQESPDESAVTVESTKWGPIRLKVWSASALGDNFMSDTFIATAQSTKRDTVGNERKTTLSTFIKVL